ncbi:MAG: trypsin-like peptidase domain-containing protein [Acidimicrobiia bacterium]
MSESPNTQERPRTSGWLSALLFFGAVALVVAGIWLVYPASSGETAAEAATTTVAPSVDVSAPTVSAGDEPIADAAEVILPSVVYIQTDSGLGSGVVYDSDGLIITAAHVVEGSDTVRVRFADGEQTSGTVVGSSPQVDIAVIRVDRTGLTAATFADTKPRVGQMAIAVGSPWGLESTVTAGIISAIDQTNCSADACTSMVQTDAAINPGNSGGALVDRTGQVVGINVSIFSNSGANDGVGFAVPADIAATYADAIVSGEPIETAFLGVSLVPGDVDTDGQAGAVVESTTADSGAELAGLEPGDVIIAFDGVPVLGGADLQAQVRAHLPGDTVEVLILRDGTQLTVNATLGVNTEQVG